MKIRIVKSDTAGGIRLLDENGKDIGDFVTGIDISCRSTKLPKATIHIEGVEIDEMDAECDFILFNGIRFKVVN